MSSTNLPGAVDDLTRLYRETILHHAHHPVGFRKAIRETHRNEQFNPLCGDRIVGLLELEGEIIRDAAFDGEACAICKSSASLLCERSPGRSVGSMLETQRWLESALQRDEDPAGYEELQPLLGVRRYPSRIRCALLPWVALAEAVQTSGKDRIKPSVPPRHPGLDPGSIVK